MMMTAVTASDGSRDSAKNIIENDAIIVTATNQQEINTNIMKKDRTLPQRQPSHLRILGIIPWIHRFLFLLQYDC